MPEKVRDIHPPTGLARLAFRAPIMLYRIGLGWLLGSRFLELSHRGRKSGLLRHTVLEVVRYDQETGIYMIAAGFGRQSDWYKNLLANPQVEVRSGGKHLRASAVLLPPQEAGAEMVRYAHDHPIAFRELGRIMGYRVGGSEADIHAIGEHLPMFALHPVPRPNE
jgi:deazaflavin-dependent oxidoreductase (nitroreductase family)